MKLFKTNKIDIIRQCQQFFNYQVCQLPTEMLNCRRCFVRLKF